LGQGQAGGSPGKTALTGNLAKTTQLVEFNTLKDFEILYSA
jgi:hypothetical protein